MPWIYHQSTGVLEHNGMLVATGYSGMGNAKNNPAMESIHDNGPIPRGRYHIGRPTQSPITGPHIMHLTPQGHNAHGRTRLEIHGDSLSHPGRASSGCIILPLAIRQQISNSGDDILDVVY